MDPTYSCSDRVLGQSFGVRYVFYEIPGGTQVDVTIEHSSQSFTRPSFARAVRRERRRIAGDLATVKDRLE
jgi:hypothetical protein